MTNGKQNGYGTNEAAVVRSEGQRQLMALTENVTQIAHKLEVPRTSVSEWRSGRHAPAPECRAKLQSVYGIARHLWAVPPTAANEAPTMTDPAPRALGDSAPTTLEDCMELLAVLRVERYQPGLKPGDRVRLSDAEARILSLRARLEAAQELSEDRYVYDHPAWCRLKRAILAALEPFPAAGLAVRKAFRAIGENKP